MRRRIGPRSRSKIELDNDASHSARVGFSSHHPMHSSPAWEYAKAIVENDCSLTYLLRAQRLDRIHQTGAARGKQACEQRRQTENSNRRREQERIVR